MILPLLCRSGILLIWVMRGVSRSPLMIDYMGELQFIRLIDQYRG